MNTYQDFYINSIIRHKLIDKGIYRNIYEIPYIKKVVVELSTSSMNEDKLIESIYGLELITRRKPIIIRARKSEAAFKLREGQYMGAKVTLRKLSALELLLYISDLISYRTSEIKLFSPKTLIKETNSSFSFGLDDISKFPEIEYEYENIRNRSGLNIHVIFSTSNFLEKKMLLSLLGFGIL